MKKRSSSTSTAKSGRAQKNEGKFKEQVVIDWEMRPGGLLVQRRSCTAASAGAASQNISASPMIKIKVSHASYHHDISVPAQSTFGDLKGVLAHETGLEPEEQRILFRGKEKDDEEFLHIAGVKDMSKVMLLQDPASKEKKLEKIMSNAAAFKAYEAVSKVRAQVDKLSDKVLALEAAVNSGTKVVDKEFVVLTELLMMQLLKLDSIEAEGDAKVERRVEIRRVQSFVSVLDNLKAINRNPFSNSSSSSSSNNNNNNAVSVITKWESSGSGFGSLTAPPPTSLSHSSSTRMSRDWEHFD